jgi:hypothetical protein
MKKQIIRQIEENSKYVAEYGNVFKFIKDAGGGKALLETFDKLFNDSIIPIINENTEVLKNALLEPDKDTRPSPDVTNQLYSSCPCEVWNDDENKRRLMYYFITDEFGNRLFSETPASAAAPGEEYTIRVFANFRILENQNECTEKD